MTRNKFSITPTDRIVQPVIDNSERQAHKLSLIEIQICREISNRKPVGASTVFRNTVDSLYCYTLFSNSEAKQKVKYFWYFENQIMTQVRYSVKKSKGYNSWKKKLYSLIN